MPHTSDHQNITILGEKVLFKDVLASSMIKFGVVEHAEMYHLYIESSDNNL